MRALLLNASYEPLRVISRRDAMTMVLTGRAIMVKESGDEWHTPTRAYAVPAVIRLINMVKVPFTSRVPLNRRTLKVRDNGECQVTGCTSAGTTVDHILPRSRGGEHTWQNTVLMCKPHNEQKDDKLLSDMGWTLKATPRAPAGPWLLLTAAQTEVQEDWLPYLGLDDPASVPVAV